MANIQTTINHAEQHCKSHGTRLTKKRKHVLSGLLKSNKALSAYELIDYCNKMFDENIPAMSIYRILVFLQNEHLVHKLNLTNKYVACSYITCDNTHEVPQFLICNHCNSVKEIPINQSLINTLKKNLDGTQYQLVDSQLELHCVCQLCATSVN